DSKNYSITKAAASCSVTGYNVAYNGLSHTATGSCLGAKGETLAGLVLSGTTHTNVGDYTTDPWTFTDVTGNYSDTGGTVHDQITIVGSTTTVVLSDDVHACAPNGGSASWTIAGTAGHGASVAVSSAARNDNVYVGSSTAPTAGGDDTK